MLVELARINKKELVVCSSLDVADTFGKEHRRVMQDIRELGCSDQFNKHNFVLISYIDSMNRKKPMYQMTRDGFTLLVMGYTGDKAMKFKEAYIKQFNAMEKTLQGKLIEREKGIAVRQSLTKALQVVEEDRMHGHAYSTYTNSIYKVLFGKSAKQLKTKYGLSQKDSLRDYFGAEELKAIESMERMVSGLVDCGWGYDKIKSFIENTNTKQLVG
ncbi:Rha protein, phage phi-80 [Lachnospiraceae bacterium KM106-2]|nr:Rha protein, phage phi-80 [Lachnospiraceae bacterium KM106-2]